MVLVKFLNKKFLYKWHRRLGMTLGFLLFLLGLSGVILTYRDELLAKVYPNLMHVDPLPERSSLASQMIAARDYLKGQNFTHLYTSEREDTASMFFYKPEGAYLPHIVAIDPYTATITGEMPIIKNIFGLMLYLHANFLLGKPGSWVVGIMGLFLTMFFLSGIYIWWPRHDMEEKIKRLPRAGIRGLHRGVGLTLGLPLVFTAITGFILAFDLGYPLGRLFGDKAKPEDIVQILPCSFDEQFRTLNVLTPAQQLNLISIHFCSPKNGLMKFSYGHAGRTGHDGYVKIVVDPRDHKTLQTFDTKTDPSGWSANTLLVYPLHTGAYFGGLGRILILLCGFALVTLYITGLLAALKRRPPPKI